MTIPKMHMAVLVVAVICILVGILQVAGIVPKF
jgi:hypothetical protein